MNVCHITIEQRHVDAFGDFFIDIEAARVVAVADRLENKLTLLTHAQGAEAVEDGEGLLSHQLADGDALGIGGVGWQSVLDMLQAVAKELGRM